jgi:hypothetical protein
MKYLNYNQYSYNDVIINMRAAFFLFSIANLSAAPDSSHASYIAASAARTVTHRRSACLTRLEGQIELPPQHPYRLNSSKTTCPS